MAQQGLRWSASEIALLRELYPHTPTRELSERLGRPFQATRQKARQLELRKSDTYYDAGLAGRFQSRRKTLRGRNPNPPLLVGTEVLRNGFLVRKISDVGARSTHWTYVHRAVWEEANGPVPRGYCVIFLDGDKNNMCLENLALVTNAQRNRIASEIYQAYPKELRQAVRALSKLKQKIAEKS